MDTYLTDSASVRHPAVLRVLVVAGALFGFTVLALLASGAANASEGSPPPDRPGLLDGVGNTVHDVLKPVRPVLKPVTAPVRDVSARLAPVTKPVTDTLSPVLSPVTRPVVRAAEPVLSVLRPVTRPVLHALAPVTQPVLKAVAPITAPVVHATGIEHVVPGVTGHPGTSHPRSDNPSDSQPGKRSDGGATPVSQPTAPVVSGAAVRHGPVVSGQAHHQRFAAGAPRTGTDQAGVAGPVSGSGGGGLPADVSVVSGAMSAGSSAQHGGEFAVTASGSGVAGTDRAWRAPPVGSWSLHWLEFYGNDHPS